MKRVAVKEFGARRSDSTRSIAPKADIFAPCALGAIINDDTIPQLKVEIVAGAANNQLLEERHGDALEARGITLRARLRGQRGRRDQRLQRARRLDAARSFRKADEIYDTILGVFAIAKTEKIPTYEAADRLAEQRIPRSFAWYGRGRSGRTNERRSAGQLDSRTAAVKLSSRQAVKRPTVNLSRQGVECLSAFRSRPTTPASS